MLSHYVPVTFAHCSLLIAMYVIGTAGHVDHGKSTLVRALTGIDPDRLQEEKEREMTIDLGFAWLKLDGLEEEVGVVDVPGHRDFIENMLAGVGGIDLALLVIAADEGVMPQTAEHLAILDLLAIPRGLIVLTKLDMVEDPDWVDLVQLEIHEKLAGTVLADAPILPVSARTGYGLAELRAAISQQLQTAEPRPNLGRPRLPIDRVFSLQGFGTVVTGTLLGGALRVGDGVEIQPSGLLGRIRGLQSHKTKREIALPGNRVAVNVTGVDKDDLERGQVLTAEGVLRPTLLVDVAYRHLATAETPLKHNSEVKLFVGSAEILARARVLGAAEIAPGATGWVQLALRQPAAVVRGDRFILRRPSPPTTLGGGEVLDAHPGRQHRRFRPDVLARLQTLAVGTPGDLLLQKLQRLEPIPLAKFQREAGLEPAQFAEALAEVLGDGRARQLDQLLLSESRFQTAIGQMGQTVGQYHAQYPLRLGMPREELRSRLKLTAALFNALLPHSELVEESALVRTTDHTIRFTAAQQARVDGLLAQFGRAGVNSPSVKEAQAAVGEDVYYALVDLGELVPLNEGVVYGREEYGRLVAQISEFMRQNGSTSAAEVRDLLDTSRKYVIALLEHLDQRQLTRRTGEVRELVEIKKPSPP